MTQYFRIIFHVPVIANYFEILGSLWNSSGLNAHSILMKACYYGSVFGMLLIKVNSGRRPSSKKIQWYSQEKRLCYKCSLKWPNIQFFFFFA